MLVSYKIVNKPLTSELLPEEVCPKCAQREGIQITLYLRYISTLGIPFYGIGRTTGMRCIKCGFEITNPVNGPVQKQVYSSTLKDAVKSMRANHRRTAWQLIYPWSFAIIIFISFGIAALQVRSTVSKKKQYEQMMLNPMPGDVYKANWEIKAG